MRSASPKVWRRGPLRARAADAAGLRVEELLTIIHAMSPIESRGGAILLVDDEQNILSALRRELEDWAEDRGIAVDTANSAATALTYLETRAKDVLLAISDLRMPGMLGSEFLLQVKKNYPWIATILLTGYSEAAEIAKAVRAGIFSYIPKPWDSGLLLGEIGKALEFQHARHENERYREILVKELSWAGELQRALLKPTLIDSEGAEFRSSYRPVQGLYVGGDYYDVISLSNARFLILLGDVAGHGVRAALVTGILKAVIYPEYVSAERKKDFSPAAFLSWLNTRMNFELRKTEGLVISFFAGVFDAGKRTLLYANAGQPHPLLLSGGSVRELPVSGSGLGFANTVSYPEQLEPLLPGDILFAYTDGLVEMSHQHALPARDLAVIVAEEGGARDAHRRIMERALESTGALSFEDDVTIITAKLI